MTELGLGLGLQGGGSTVPPDLSIAFDEGGGLDPSITFARGSAGTYFDSAGVIQSATNNTPRFDHHPVTLAPLGLLIEDTRTNLFLNSLINGTNLSTQGVSVTAQAYTISFYGTGTITLSGAHAQAVVGSGAFPTRRTLTFTPSAGTLTCTVTGTVQYAQIEAGTFASSFIPTAGATVTRALDVASIEGASFSAFYNQPAGTWVLEFDTHGINGNRIMVTATDSGGSNRVTDIFIGGTNQLSIFNGSGVYSSANAFTSDAASKVAAAYSAGSYGASLNGGAVFTHAFASVNTPNRIYLGTFGGSDCINGHLRSIGYYTTRRGNAELVTLST